MAKSLILFTIGPVQRFIETARKTEDLWMGSYILAYLNAIALKTLTGNFSKESIKIIFPCLDNQPLIKYFKNEETLDEVEQERLKLPTLPNRLLALDETGMISTDAMKKVEGEVRNEFETIAEYVFEQAFGRAWRGTHAQDMFNRQIKHFLEIYWVIHPMSGADYQGEYNLLERKLGGVKSCRRFEQTQEESRKCSLCGEREVIHFSPFKKENMGEMDQIIKQDWKDKWTKNEKLPSRKYLSSNEFLCAVCLTKRIGGMYFENELQLDIKGTFPSTSEVATSAFKLTIMQEPRTADVRTVYAQFVEGIRSLKYLPNIENIVKTTPLPLVHEYMKSSDIDGSWLYEETLKSENFIKYYTDYTEKELTDSKKSEIQQTLKPLAESQKHLRNIYKNDQNTSFGTHPAKYYALIAMDGDSMGEKLNHVRDDFEHSRISEIVNEYTSQNVPKIVEGTYLGKLLYAGGDDLLALANLKDLFAILRQLHQAFPSERLRAIEGLKNIATDHSFGVSAGVCIAHHKAPLGEARRLAKKMEQEAKQLDGKNGVSIALLKHSGNISTACVKWEYEQFDTLQCAIDVSCALNEWLSNKFIYSLREEGLRLVDEKGKIPAYLGNLMKIELMRLLQRRQQKGAAHKEMITQLSDQLTTLQRYIKSFDGFIGFLEICNFIAREG